MSFAFTSVPSAGTDDLLEITFGLFTVLFTVFVSTSFTFAVFVISFSNIPFVNSFTVTSNETVVLPSAGTLTSIPFFKLSDVYEVCGSSFIFMLSATNDVPSGILSFIVAFPSK